MKQNPKKRRSKNKICGLNTCSYEHIREMLKEEMAFGIPKSRSEALSWMIADLLVYCYEEGLSFERLVKMAHKQFKWSISRNCLKCKLQISPDDYAEGKGYCVCCIPKKIENRIDHEAKQDREAWRRRN